MVYFLLFDVINFGQNELFSKNFKYEEFLGDFFGSKIITQSVLGFRRVFKIFQEVEN